MNGSVPVSAPADVASGNGAAAPATAAGAVRAAAATVTTAPVTAADVRYAGLATRLIAFAGDAAVINGVALVVGFTVGLGLSLFDLPSVVNAVFVAVGAVIGCVWAMAYFVLFWSTTGQTPCDRIMQIRVLREPTLAPVSAPRAVLRALLLPLSVITFGAGLLLILVDRRRRALHDVLAGTVVVFAPVERRTARPPAAGPPA